MKLLKLINENHEDNMTLFNLDLNEMIMFGDYDNDHIEDKIDGFLEGLSYSNQKYTIKTKYINEENKLFKKCNFY